MSESGKIGVREAVELMNGLNRGITYGTSGLNAKEFQSLENLTDADYQIINKAHRYINREWYMVPGVVWLIAGVLALAGVLYLDKLSAVVSAVIMTGCIARLSYRAGVLYGFTRGYEDGHTAGVRKAFKVSDDDVEDMRERANDMSIWGGDNE